MKKTVLINPAYVGTIISPLMGLPDEEMEYRTIRGETDEKTMREVIKKWIVPDFCDLEKSFQEKLKENLAYYLCVKDIEVLKNVIMYISIPLPAPLEFFDLVWDELFHEPIPTELDPDTEYIEEDLTIYISGDED